MSYWGSEGMGRESRIMVTLRAPVLRSDVILTINQRNQMGS